MTRGPCLRPTLTNFRCSILAAHLPPFKGHSLNSCLVAIGAFRLPYPEGLPPQSVIHDGIDPPFMQRH